MPSSSLAMMATTWRIGHERAEDREEAALAAPGTLGVFSQGVTEPRLSASMPPEKTIASVPSMKRGGISSTPPRSGTLALFLMSM